MAIAAEGRMVVERGEIWWANLPEPTGSGPGYRRPVVIVQSNAFNQSRIATVIGAIITSNLRMKDAPGNIHLSRGTAGLSRESVVNISQLITFDKGFATGRVGRLPPDKQSELDAGLRLVLAL
jgi:mRNA interferase MazF